MADEMRGGCACGNVRFTADVAQHLAYLCHCRMCQRSVGSLAVAFVNVPRAGVQWQGEPDWYESSPIAWRPFCSKCGTSFGFAFKENSQNMDLTVATFDDPSRFVPRHHFGTESMHRAWRDTDGLPEQRSDEYGPLVERWTKATGAVPV